jgi:hypothetical protein
VEEKIEMKSTQRSFALAATAWLPALCLPMSFLAPAAQAQEGPAIISSRLMDALETWSSPSVTYGDLAFDSHPELIESYVPALESHYRGLPLEEIFAELLPLTLERFRSATGGDPGSAAELLAFAMSEGGAEYLGWQADLRSASLDFEAFAESSDPEIAAELAQLNLTPADQGIGLLDFVGSLDDAALAAEVAELAGTVPKKKCTCRVVVAFPEIPSSWSQEINEHFFSQWGTIIQRMLTIDYTVHGRGAARAINFYRASEHTQAQVPRDKNSNMSSMRVRMLCTLGAELPCENPVCVGQLALRIGYASRVYEKHDVGGSWSREAQAFTGDYAKLTYAGPAALGPTLFEKGVAVAGQYQSGWDPGALANLLYGGGQIVLTLASGDPNLTADMIDTTVQGIAGLYTHSGSPGNQQNDMMAAWDYATNNNSQGITLLPNQTHLFELAASSKIESYGYGKWSWTWGTVDSANYFVGVARHFQCGPNIVAPAQQAFWLQSGAGNAPYSASTLQSILNGFIQTELGVTVPPAMLANPVGHYP